MMKELKELVNLVGPNKIRNIDIVTFRDEKGSNIERLYNGLDNQGFDTEEDAIEAIFGDHPKGRYYFNKLASRLRERLYNTLFFIDVDQSKKEEIEIVYYDAYKKFAIVKILLGKGARNAAISLALKLCKIAFEFELSDLYVDVLRVLRLHYGSMVGDRKKYLFYSSQLEEAFKVLEAEMLAEKYYIEVAAGYVFSQSNQDVVDLAERYSKELTEILKTKRSYRLVQYSYFISLMRYQILNDYYGLLEICSSTLREFEKRGKLFTTSMRFGINLNILICYRGLREKEKALESARICFELIEPGVVNWFLVLEQKYLLFNQSQDYSEGVATIEEAVRHKKFASTQDRIKQQFTIYEAYCNFVVSRGKASFSDPERNKKKFRLGKFLNEVPVYSKDKRGTNIQIIIIQILTLLDQHKYGQVIDKVEALNMYCHRYLRKNDTFRSNCFIKMLLQLPAARFNRIAAERKAKKYYDRLLEMPLEKATQSSELEIIPYETLWTFVLEMLGNRHY